MASASKVALRFEDRPARDPNDRIARPEPLSMTRRDTREIIIYVMPIFERHGKEPRALREALRRIIVKELGDWVGADAATE